MVLVDGRFRAQFATVALDVETERAFGPLSA